MKDIMAYTLLEAVISLLLTYLDVFDHSSAAGRPVLRASKWGVDWAVKVDVVFLDEPSECRFRA
jgi:hypothetical protein